MWIPTRIPSSLFSQLHPIEFSLSVIKSALRGSHQLQGNENIEELAEKVKNDVNEQITLSIARSQFRHCRVISGFSIRRFLDPFAFLDRSFSIPNDPDPLPVGRSLSYN